MRKLGCAAQNEVLLAPFIILGEFYEKVIFDCPL